MGSKSPPSAPKSPVSTGQLSSAFKSASSNIDTVAGNNLPRQAYDFFAPQLMSATPYGYDPSQYVDYANQWAAQGPQMFDYANQVMQEGFDPQDAYYNRSVERLQNQSRAAQGARGIQMSPHGAAIEGAQLADFNLDWRDRQLQRQALASQSAANLFGQGGQAISGAANVASGVPRSIVDYAGMLQQLGIQAFNPQMFAAQQYGNLFGTGAGAQQGAYQNQLGAYKAEQDASNSFWGGIGNLAGTLGSAAIQASDRRVKENVIKIGDDPRGWGIYRFNYIGDDEPVVGYMADEVELVYSEAVITDPVTSMKFINYSTLQ